MNKETAIINIRVACVDTRKSINCFTNLMKLNLNVLDALPEQAESVRKSALKITTRSLQRCVSSAENWSGRGTN